MVALFERLERSHEVVPPGDARGDDALGDAGGDGAFNDGGDGVHRPHDLVLELGWDVEFDLLEEVFGGAEAADDEDVLCKKNISDPVGKILVDKLDWMSAQRTCSILFCA